MRDYDVVISSRIRFARNIKDYPFASKLDKTSALEIIEKISDALGEGYRMTDFSKLSSVEQNCYVESRIVSPAFARTILPHALFEKDDTHIMVCEEDHIRLQVIKKGFEIESCYKEACRSDDLLINKLRVAFDEKLGFLTHCPTNLGTAMRASVMMFLPGLVMTRQMNSIISQLGKLGMTIRGLYGEGSEALGYLYQISNAVTLGITEEEIIQKLTEIINQITDYERKARDVIRNTGIKTEDSVCRALGAMLYARTITSGEFMELYSKVRLGITLNIIDNVSLETLDDLFIKVMPNSISKEKKLSYEERDKERAKLIKDIIMK